MNSEKSFLSTSFQASVPKFDKVPWPGEASLRNKPLVLSLPKRSPHSYAIFPTSSKDMNLSILFHVPDVFSKVRKNQNNSMLLPNKPLCSTCQEISMIQSRPLRIPDGLKLSFKNFVSHRTMSLPQPQTQTFPKPSRDDIPTESIHYKLPILGPRTAVFHGLLSDAYKSLQEMEQTSLLRKEPTGKTVRTRCLGSERPHHASL
uniref:Chromosome 1 open reading frame 105 n=1 Tax=Oryctolagus cuniculus TaxID=9986 RepID=A0A5F9DEN5_RABIT